AIALTFILSLGCVTASPTFGGIAASKSVSVSASSSSYSSSSYNYYSADVCTAVGFSIREDLPTCIFDELEQQFLQKKCELLNSYGVYPRDIGPSFCDLQPDSLYYDIVLVGSGPSGLSSLQSFLALGKRVLLIDRGDFAPACADSLYYRSSLYSSQYVTPYPGCINGVDITKNLYSYNILGGCAALDSNTWNIGNKYLYEQLAQINDQWSWEKVYGYYKGLECYKSRSVSVSKTTSTSTSSSSSSSSSAAYGSSLAGSSYSASSSQQTTTSTTTTYEYSTSGLYSIYNSFQETYLTKTLSSVFDELGYCNSPSPFDLLPNKYCILPCLGDIDRPSFFPHTVFSGLEQYKSNIDFALRTTAN
uniref:hypothetical protein n=1 Tax=Providencia sp. PROV040 TaxID=2949771 RepID=UPI00234A87DC